MNNTKKRKLSESSAKGNKVLCIEQSEPIENDESDDCLIVEKDITIINLDATNDDEATKILDLSDEEEPTVASSTLDVTNIKNSETATINPDKLISNDVIIINGDSVQTTTEPKTNNLTNCMFHIKFNQSDTYTELKTIIGKAITDAMFSLNKSIEIMADASELTLAFINRTIDENSMFIIDSIPTNVAIHKQSVPVYCQSTSIIDNEKFADPSEEEPQRLERPKNLCFNCDGDHSIRDCTEPRNHAKIKQNRLRFSTGKSERYHVDIEQRFGQFTPGVISDELRKALNLRQHELPMHIYKMRIIGYPPGWLENATISKSGLTLFDAKVNLLLILINRCDFIAYFCSFF